jgi:hypothetical protein
VSSDLTEHARSANVDQLLKEAGRALEARRLGMALNAFRRAADASLGSEGLRRRVFDRLLDGAGAVTGADWRLAESMLSLAEGLNTNWRAPAQIWQPIERELSEEYIRSVLADGVRSEALENLPQFRGRVVYALHRYPGEPRLQKRLELIDRALESPLAPAPPPSAPPRPVVQTSVPLPELAPASVWNWTRSVWVGAAVVLLSIGVFFTLRNNQIPNRPDPVAKSYIVPPRPTKESPIPPKVATAVKIRLSDRKPLVAVTPKAPAPLTFDLAADSTLAQVSWNNRQIMDGIAQAEKALGEQAQEKEKAARATEARLADARKVTEQALASAAMNAREREAASNAVAAMLQRYVNAWNTKDVDSITALHRSLDRRTVKAQLAPVTAIRMIITPASDPRIDGERGTIVCRRQVEETFSDGTQKQSPALLVTFTLSKHDGQWGIDDAQ